MNLFRGNSQNFHALFTRFSWTKLRVFSWGQPMKIPLKTSWKYFEKFTINGPWNSLDYKKCNEKHMKKPWLVFNGSWLWLVLRFSWCSGKGHEIYPDSSWCANSWQFNGTENSWVIIIPLKGNFIGPWRFSEYFSDLFTAFLWPMKCILCLVLWHFHGLK